MLVLLWLTLMMTTCFKYGISLWRCFTFLISLYIQLVFGSSASITRLNLFFGCFLDGFRFFKGLAGIVCHAFEVFSRGYILTELEMTVVLFQLSLASILFSILLLCLCILWKPAVFDFINCVSFVHKYYRTSNEEEQSHFIITLKINQI